MTNGIVTALPPVTPTKSDWPMQQLAGGWWLVAASSELKNRTPLAVTALGRKLVLFRNEHGQAQALEDKCPHRHVALSLGKVHEGQLQCLYHGWRFDGSGQCVHVPTQAGACRSRARAASFALHEADGSIWLWTGPADAVTPCTGWAYEGKRHHATAELRTQVACSLVQTLNNFVDCAHTGFVHAGLFRSAPSREVTAVARETPTGVLIETLGESDQNSLLGRLLVAPGESVRHTDELILPDTVRVIYQFGRHRIVTISTCLAENENSTRIFTRLYVDLGLATQPALLLLKPMTRKILAQDKVILDNQGAQIAKHGHQWEYSSAADMPTVWVERAFRAWCEKRFPPDTLKSASISYLL